MVTAGVELDHDRRMLPEDAVSLLIADCRAVTMLRALDRVVRA